RQDQVEAIQVVFQARQMAGDVFASEQDRLVLQAAERIAKAIMKGLTENDNSQLGLPGLTLPSAIAVPQDEEGGYYYVRTDKAHWPELLAGRELRVENVQRAQAKLDAYEESLRLLRPVMEDDVEMTVGDALRH